MEERPLCRAQPQQRTGKGIHWKAPVPGAVDPPNWPIRKTRVHAHRSRASTALTLVACHPGWDDYLDLTKTVTEMAHRLMREDGQEVAMPPKVGATPKKKEAAKSVVAPVNEGIAWVTSDQFPSDQRPGASRDNPVHLSDATDASALGLCPRKDDDFDDEAKLLGHFSDALREMATSIVDLEDGYFRALHEVIVETERALWDMSHIDAHYVSQVVTVMSS